MGAGPKQWWRGVKRITGKSQQHPLKNLAIGGNVQKFAQDINTFFHSMSSDLSLLDMSLVPDLDADALPD